MRKTLSRNLLAYFILLVAFSSCINQKQIAYFQKGAGGSDTIGVAEAYIPTIQSGDILGIYVSSLNSTASSFFNPFAQQPSTAGETTVQGTSGGGQSNAQGGYLVDISGNIELPLLGPIKVTGLNTVQAKELIKTQLAKFLKEPTVNVRFLNYKVSIMGEVARPSVYTIANEKITLPEALTMAGDLTIYGRRENVLVIRDNNGKKEFARLDLTTRDIYNSPYFYLHANDVVYVEPSKGRIAQTDKTYQLLPIIISSLSLISVLVITLSRK